MRYELRRTSEANPAAFEVVGWTDDLQDALSHAEVGRIWRTMDGDFDTKFQVWDSEAKAYAFDGLTQYLRRDASIDENAPYEVRGI